MTLHLQFHNNF